MTPSTVQAPKKQELQSENQRIIPHFRTRSINGPLSDPSISPKGRQTKLPPGWRLRHEGQTYSFKVESLEGQGTFGRVYKARILETKEIVAIKQVEIQRGYAFREVEVLSSLQFRNICKLKMSFTVPRSDDRLEAFLVMEYIPNTLSEVIKLCRGRRRRLTENYIMLLMYQLLKGLEFIHSKDVCHRDLKPGNILLNLATNELKICDFGSAKVLTEGDTNATYVCSRFYRAPELILSCQYTKAMDMWSAGCILAEMYLSDILFKGATSLEQIIEIIRVIGTPTKGDLEDLGRKDTPSVLRNCPPRPWKDVLGEGVGEQAIDLISNMLVFSPIKRFTATQALHHEYFDRIRSPGFSIHNGYLPQLFDSEEERQIRRRNSGNAGSSSSLKIS